MESETLKHIKGIVFLTLIAGRKQKDAILEALSEAGIGFENTMYGRGSVKASYLKDLLGLVPEENKVIITCLLQSEKTDATIAIVDKKISFNTPNTGIAFTIPVERLSTYRRDNEMDSTKGTKALFIIVNAGFVNEAMEIARANGAGGATIMSARGEGAMHRVFMGITVDAEKEIIISLVNADTAEKIMAAIQEKAGLKSPAHGICFTLPVEKMTGLSEHHPIVQKPEE